MLQRSKIADLAARIDQRAQQGLTVHLKPATARTVAITMRLYAEGHPSLRDSHPHHVEDWTDEPHTVPAYCANASLAVGAWEHYVAAVPAAKSDRDVGRMDCARQQARSSMSAIPTSNPAEQRGKLIKLLETAMDLAEDLQDGTHCLPDRASLG